MVILGITGTLSSGKETAVNFLNLSLGFIIINLESESWESLHPRTIHLGSSYSTDLDYKLSIAKSVLDQITENPKQHTIIYPIVLPEELLIFRKRPYFFLLGIDSPSSLRYTNYIKKHGKPKNQVQGFAYMDDHTKFGLDGFPSKTWETLLSSDRIIQNKGTTDEFLSQINTLDILNPGHLRPSWDTYFIRLAHIASTRSTCLLGKKGAIIVRESKVVSTGYNGTPAQFANCSEGGCRACVEFEDCECVCIHAEINALIEAGRVRTIGSQMYLTHFPCFACAKSIVQSQVEKVIYSDEESLDEGVLGFLAEGGVRVLHQGAVV